MRTNRRYVCLFGVVLAVCAGLWADGAATLRETAQPTPLDTYVGTPDANFSYELAGQYDHEEFTGYVLKLISQQWRTDAEVNQPIWHHWLEIIVPKQLKSETAMMLISGGNNDEEAPKGKTATLTRVARGAHAVVAQVTNIPNEPLYFKDETDRRRSEDSIIAYAWDKFMKTGDANWLLRLPMTKAVVRAMDAVQLFLASDQGGKVKVSDFVTAGASKRGWTTWTVTAVDKRVVACVPIVIDLLNLAPSFEHHWEMYGEWAPAIGDYTDMHVMDWLNTPEFKAMLDVVDPYSYRARYTMPKMIMCGTQDQFFCPDSSQFYLNDLPGPTYLRYVPNAGHGLDASAKDTVTAFFASFVMHKPMPKYSWSFPDANTIRVETPDTPAAVKLWQATNPEARNFRLDVVGKLYTESPLTDQGNGVYTATVPTPEKGWSAFLIELTFPSPVEDAPFIVTTPVRIVPETMPAKWVPNPNPPKGFLSK